MKRKPLICKICTKPETLTEVAMVFADFLKHNQVHALLVMTSEPGFADIARDKYARYWRVEKL